MNPNKALWEKGDFTRIAATMRESGEALVQRLGIMKGMKVLDLGCGDGTTAVPQAKLGADVTGIDIARNLVEAGNKRAAKHGLGCEHMVSRAYHDSLFMARIAPVAMLFIPCRGGFSHRPDEYASPEAITAGTLVLAETLAELAL